MDILIKFVNQSNTNQTQCCVQYLQKLSQGKLLFVSEWITFD